MEEGMIKLSLASVVTETYLVKTRTVPEEIPRTVADQVLDYEDDIIADAIEHYRKEIRNGDSAEFQLELWCWYDPDTSVAEYKITREDGIDELPGHWFVDGGAGQQHLVTLCVEVFGHKVIL